MTVLAIAAFAAAVALGLLAIGPFVMGHLFGQHYTYGRFGLALIGVGMGLHLTSGALNQAALARDRARAAALLLGARGGAVPRVDVRPRRSANSCCAPRSATPARPRCWRCCWRCSTAAADRQRLAAALGRGSSPRRRAERAIAR